MWACTKIIDLTFPYLRACVCIRFPWSIIHILDRFKTRSGEFAMPDRFLGWRHKVAENTHFANHAAFTRRRLAISAAM